MENFYIRVNSVNPLLRMEVIDDGRYDYRKDLLNKSLMDCNVTFSMKDVETGLLKISKAHADVVTAKLEGCEEKLVLQYSWKERDTRNEGVYEGWFDINFNGNLTEHGEEFLRGSFRVPIQEKLIINIIK